MAYTPGFTPTYEDGWEDLPLETTPITAEALNNYDEAIEKIEEYLAQGGGGSEVSITPTLQSGTKIADFEINGEPGVLYAPAGGSLEVIAEEYDETFDDYNENDLVIYNNKLYRCKTEIIGEAGEFDYLYWEEIKVADELLPYEFYTSPNHGQVLEWSENQKKWMNGEPKTDTKAIGTDESVPVGETALAHQAYAVGDYFYMNGYFCKAIQAIAVNDTLTLNTNYQRVSIASEIGQGGGGGSSTLAGLTDTTITSPTDGQVLKYDATNQKWVNANESGGGNSDSYSTTEQAIGTWVDGRTIYRKCFTITSVSPPNPGNWCTLADVSITDLDFIIKGFGYLSTTKVAKIYGWKINNNNVQCIYHTGDFKPATGEIISVDYVKTTI